MIKKTGVSTSGVFTIKEYVMEDHMGIPDLIRRLDAGEGKVQEVISYVFEGEDPLQIDTKSFGVEDFLELYPQMKTYGPGLAFDVVIRTGGQPVTVELTQGEQTVCINSLDKEVELEDFLGEPGTKSAPIAEECDPVVKADAPGTARKGNTRDTAAPETAEQEDEPAQEMTPQDLLGILAVAERLKCNTRHCDTSNGRRESVAEHSWRTALMAMLLSGLKEYSRYDMNRVIRMCLIHDLGEAFTGDIPTFEKTTEDEKRELSALDGWIDSLPSAQKKEFQALFFEMNERRTPEAKLYKAIDKIEAVIQHNESDISSWLPLEYDLQLTYGQEEAQVSPWFSALRALVETCTREKIDNASSE